MRNLPIYHPTSLVAVDDDNVFLESLSSSLFSDLICHTYDNPEAGLRHVLAARHPLASQQDWFRGLSREYVVPIADDSGPLRRADRAIAWSPDCLLPLMSQPERFGAVSVAIVDYDMPAMDGLEFCRRLQGQDVQRVLLTGKADHNVAVRAFNERLIEAFIIKQDDEAPAKILATIQEAQSAFFDKITRPVQDVLRITDNEHFGSDPVDQWLGEILSRARAEELYYAGHPKGYILLSDTGRQQIALIQSETDIREHLEVARFNGAPEELISRMSQSDTQPWFPTERGLWESGIANWSRFVFPATAIEGGWRCSLIEDAQALLAGRYPPTTYADFREARDASNTIRLLP